MHISFFCQKKQCSRETELLRQIKHENVVALIDCVDDAIFPQKDKVCQIQTYCTLHV